MPLRAYSVETFFYWWVTGVIAWPMLSSSFLSARLSRLFSGRQRNRLILRSRIKNASRNARSTSASLPRTAAGSGTPQWAVMGCPGHTGQTSLAALSQTVKTKSSLGGAGQGEFVPGLAAQTAGRQMRHFELPQGLRSNRFPKDDFRRCKPVKLGWPLKFRMASAMIERAELPVHRNKTL